jgi:tetratricopeptide (TPR) repeat protein
MVFDPLDPDIEHIRRFQQVIASERLQLLAVPYAGHPAGQYLLELKMLGDVGLTALKEGRFASIAVARRQHKSHSTIYLFQLVEHCQRRRHLHWALAINKRLIAMLDHPEYQLQACRILRKLGRFDEAVAAVDRALGFADYAFRPNIEIYRRDMLAQRAAA